MPLRTRARLLQMIAGGLALTVLASPSQVAAEPRPTLAQVRAKLVKLNEQADEVVEQYNQAEEAVTAADKKYRSLNATLKKNSAHLDGLKRQLVSLAVGRFQTGGFAGARMFASPGGSDRAMDQMLLVDQIARTQSEVLRAYEATSADLRERRDQAKVVLTETDAARDKLGREKKKVEGLIREQTKLLRRLNTYRVGNPNGSGVKYTGSASGDARTALQFAFAQIGKPYQYGSEGPGSWDCSSLTQAAWASAGVQLPRTTYTQWAWGAGRRVSLDALQPGDLLFSNGLGHMGMYAGDGKMVHAPQTGDVVKVVDLDAYWRGRLLGAVRP